MNDRDELADILMSDTLREAAYYGRNYALAEADDILAAGYRKPRQITTVEELDALLMGSKVVVEGYEWTKNYVTINTPSGGIEREAWFNVYDDFETSADLALPATVLWEPLPDCCTADGPTCATCASYAAEDAEPLP